MRRAGDAGPPHETARVPRFSAPIASAAVSDVRGGMLISFMALSDALEELCAPGGAAKRSRAGGEPALQRRFVARLERAPQLQWAQGWKAFQESLRAAPRETRTASCAGLPPSARERCYFLGDQPGHDFTARAPAARAR